MTYTRKAPTKPGAYWWKRSRREPEREAFVALVRYAKGGCLEDESSGLPPCKVGGVWSPRLVPERKKKP